MFILFLVLIADTSNLSPPCWDLLNHIGKSNQNLEELQLRLESLEPRIVRALETSKSRSCTLRGDGHCGWVAKFIYHLFEGSEFERRTFYSQALPGDHRFLAYPDHTFFVTRINGKEVIVDGAFIQFLKQLDPTEKLLPRQSILILPYEDLNLFIEQILRLWRLSRYRARQPSTPGSELIEWGTIIEADVGENEVRRLYEDLWNIRAPHYIENTSDHQKSANPFSMVR